MKTIVSTLKDLSLFVGVEGCALVETNTGMVWHYAGKLTDMELVGEAAVEFWRTQRRVATQLEQLGELNFVTFKYALKTLALIPCDASHDLILVCLAGSKGVDWQGWIQQLPKLRNAIHMYIEQGNNKIK